MSVRLGAVSYLNARPLTFFLEQIRSSFEIDYSVPSRCAADLHAGRIDLGLIPSIEYARGPEPYCIVPDVAIAARGEVLSVRLFWRGAFHRIGRVALDLSSRTSAVLLRVLLREKFRLEPEFVEAKPDLEGMLEIADAALLIGDAVFQVGDSGCESLDMGKEWVEFSGHPFVFAFWAGRAGALSPDQVRQMIQARDEGRERIEEIARDFYLKTDGWAEEGSAFYERYLSENIWFDLGEAELQGLRMFYDLAWKNGLIESVPELRFYQRVETSSAVGGR